MPAFNYFFAVETKLFLLPLSSVFNRCYYWRCRNSHFSGQNSSANTLIQNPNEINPYPPQITPPNPLIHIPFTNFITNTNPIPLELKKPVIFPARMQQGGSQYQIPQPQNFLDLVTAAESRGISGRTMGNMRAQDTSSTGFEELSRERFGEEERFSGKEGDRGFAGNRWPRQETLALLKIRSDMDGAFHDAIVKGPLWEEIARKLAELGYYRSAKKCREKFENVHKYYKRTKQVREARQDGKGYKFFSQLEALNNNQSSNPNMAPNCSQKTGNFQILVAPNSSQKTGNFQTPAAPPLPSPSPPQPPTIDSQINPTIETLPDFTIGVKFSSSDEDSGDPTENSGDLNKDHPYTHKRKRSHESSTKKIMSFFEKLMSQVLQKQERLQQRLLEAMEKQEQERVIREEAWKKQEMIRLKKEEEFQIQERSISASRDAAMIAFLQKITGKQPSQIPIHEEKSVDFDSPQDGAEPAGVTTEIFDPTSSRWPKSEVQALIKLRSELGTNYHETCPKGSLWEEISLAMKQLGYNRSTKRCKEKWENINKYFKKVKESNKERPEDAKTCPYFHQLDALYKKKMNQKKSAEVSPKMPVPTSEAASTDRNSGNSGNLVFCLDDEEAKKVNEKL